MGRVVIPGFRKVETSGGGEGGTSNYNDLKNKPSINNIPLVGNLSTVDLKLTDKTLKEEGVPADAKTVGQKLEEQSTSLTKLSNQLGNHTVKSDVPENAVFTDTTYNIATTTANGLMSKEHVSKLNNIRIKTYTSIESLGLSGTPTVNEIKLAMPLYSELLIEVNFLASQTDSEGNTLDNASCRIVKLNSDGRAWAEAHGKSDGKHYVMRLGKNGTSNDFTEIWEQIAMNSDIKSYLPLSGGTMTGTIRLTSGDVDCANVLWGDKGIRIGNGYSLRSNAKTDGCGLKFTYFTNPTFQILPESDNIVTLGHSSYRFAEFRCNNIYISSGTAVTSDRRYKDDIGELDEELSYKFIMALVPSSFKYKDGESGRIHYGLIAQDVEKVLASLGLSNKDFGGIVIEKLTKEVEVETVNDDGETVVEKHLEETGEIKYDLRYDEFIAPLIKTVQIQQKTIKNLEERLLKLENQILDNK